MANFWLKMCPKYFCQNLNQVVRVKDFKYSFNMKYQQNPMSRQGEIAQNDNFGVKMDIFWSKISKKMVKNIFSQNFNQVIIVKDHKYSFNMKQQQNPMSRQGEIGQNVNFWVKKDFSQNFHWAILAIDPKCSFYKENQQSPMTGFGEIDQNDCFWAKMGYF